MGVGEGVGVWWCGCGCGRVRVSEYGGLSARRGGHVVRVDVGDVLRRRAQAGPESRGGVRREPLLEVLQRRLERAHHAQLRLQPGEAPDPEDLSGARLLVQVGVVVRPWLDGLRVRLASAPRERLGDLAGGQRGHQLAPDQGARAEEQAPQPLVDRQTRRAERHAAELDYYHLRKSSSDPYRVENGVGEQPLEHIPLAVDLPRVDLVEQGHHNERVEDYREMLGRLRA